MMKLNLRVLFILFWFLISISERVSAQIVINEFMSDNTTAIVDQDGDFSDWIE